MSTVTAHQQDIVISGPEPLVIDPTSAKRRPVLNQDEARMLTTEIQRTTVRLWLLVTEAHDRAAHFALGYDSWDDYVRAEFKMSPSRSYQLVDTGHVMRELAVAGADLDTIPAPPTRIVSRIKDRLPEVRKATRAAIKSGEDPIKALREMARTPRIPQPRGSQEQAAPEAEPEPEDTKTITVTCPACDGDGKVTRSMANRLRAVMRRLTADIE
jgi:hypothetical protein